MKPCRLCAFPRSHPLPSHDKVFTRSQPPRAVSHAPFPLKLYINFLPQSLSFFRFIFPFLPPGKDDVNSSSCTNINHLDARSHVFREVCERQSPNAPHVFQSADLFSTKFCERYQSTLRGIFTRLHERWLLKKEKKR